MNFSMWASSASCWGFSELQATNYFHQLGAPQVTRGFSYGYNGKLTSSGGIKVSSLNTTWAASSAAGTACPTTPGSTSGSVCLKWTMSVPGVAPNTVINTSAANYSSWNALIDVIFHAVATPSNQGGYTETAHIQIYQMVMDYQVNGNPNWAMYIVGANGRHYATKTINGVPYIVSVNMGDTGNFGNPAYVGSGGTANNISMFVLPAPAPIGSGNYLWGQASAVHDFGGIISWLSQTTTGAQGTGIYDDAGNLLISNVGGGNVTSALINPAHYLTGLNPNFEVYSAATGAFTSNNSGAAASGPYTNNTNFTTTDFWVALPGEIIGD
jgi:hypothetical protein